ncbi:MAG: hypothetical protein GXP55_22430 [Deltaproteobacteria bacterium]|nr:hypothetical protein [Deltaproteobacteria bacterium]
MTMPYATASMRALSALGLTLLALGSGCATSTIPNTTVQDTAENRDILNFIEEYRHAVERRDVGKILAMASPRYLDDNGTPPGDDDIDFDRLREKLLRWADSVPDVRYEIHYRHVTRRGGRILVDYRYTASYRLTSPDGEDHWSRRMSDNRIVLQPADPDDRSHEVGRLLAISGF